MFLRVTFLFLLLLQNAWAQELSSYKTLHYSPKDGLSFAIVNSIAQDNKGFMWFATADGLNRFDGSTFKVFKFDSQKKYSLSSNYVQKVFTDSEGTLWVSSRKGLNRFDPKQEHFLNYRFTQAGVDDDVSNISERGNGNLWIATSADGFYDFNKKLNTFVHYTAQSLPGLKENSILNVFEDSFGRVWVGTRDSGLQLFRHALDGRLKNIPLEESFRGHFRVNNIYEDAKHQVWIATSEGLIFYQPKVDKLHWLNIDSDGKRHPYLSITENAGKEIVVGIQNKGLYRLDQQELAKQKPANFRFRKVESKDGFNLTERSIQSLFLDRDQNTWVGTYGDGVYMISNKKEKFAKFQKQLPDEAGGGELAYYGMCLDDEGNLWLGTDGDGIYKTSPTGKVLKHYSADGKKGSLKDNAILYAYKDRKNNLWFGSYSTGLYRYDKRADAFLHYQHDPEDSTSIGANDVRVMHQGHNGMLWIGTNGGGLSMFDPRTETFSSVSLPHGTVPQDIRAIVEDKKGNLWIGSYGGGLNYFDIINKKWERKLQDPKNQHLLSNNVVFSLHLDKHEQLWMGTEGDGLILYNTQTDSVDVYNENKGLANNTIYAIQEDAGGKIWVSTNKGISQVDPQTHALYNFHESDGLQGGHFSERSALYSETGKFMCFGGTEGWNIFYPKEVQGRSTYSPAILITGLELFGKSTNESDNWNPLDKDLSESEEITLKPNQSFSIHYVALNYTYPKEGSFAYQMEGLDEDWVYVKGQRLATYRYLDPGTYVFKVKASNQDGIWSDQYKSMTIKILPPWYRTWWAYILYVALSLTAFVVYLQYKANQSRLKYQLKVSQLEALQEKELHEKKLSFFTNISHEFRTPLTLIISPVKELLYTRGSGFDVSQMNIVYRNAKRLLSLVDQLLLFGKDEANGENLRITKFNLSDLCKEVFYCFSYEAKIKNIRYVLLEGDEPIELYGDREKLEIVFYNLVSNAFKFTPEFGAITFELLETSEEITINIQDSGSGIPADIGAKLFDRFYQVLSADQKHKGGFGIGLYLVKSIIDSHKGSVMYSSSLGQGARFEMTFQQGKEHFNPNLIFEELAERISFLEEFIPEMQESDALVQEEVVPDDVNALTSDRKTLLIIDDHTDIRHYIMSIFKEEFTVLESDNGEDGLAFIKKYLPDLVISDVMMPGLNGIELCNLVKEDIALNHIPVILLTASASSEIKLKGIEFGADDYISKPFDKAMLYARVVGILKSRNTLQSYFYNEITLKPNHVHISAENKAFLERCMQIVENHLENPDFGIKDLVDELAMSRSNLYAKIKSISGQSINGFIRFIRLRKAAELLLSTDLTIYQTAERVGIKDLKYFREQFKKLFHMNPSEYVKKFRQPFHNQYTLKKEMMDQKVE